jgi:hypothetical protein
MIPGRYPKHVKIMLIRRSPVHPRSRKTPRGGRRMARRILQISLRGSACEQKFQLVSQRREKKTHEAVKAIVMF